MAKDSKNTKNIDAKNNKTAPAAKPAAKPVVKPAVKGAAKQTVAKPVKTGPKPTSVVKGVLVSVDYVGTLDNGEVFDDSKSHGPIKFIAGNSQVIKGFDDAVLGMKAKESKKVNITKENAYGDINPALLHKVPLDKLPPEMKDKVKVGGFIVLQSPVGQQIPAKVKSIDKDSITLDLNHPLAGKNLTFNITVVDIQNAPPASEGCGEDCGCTDEGCDCDDAGCHHH